MILINNNIYILYIPITVVLSYRYLQMLSNRSNIGNRTLRKFDVVI